MQYLQFNSSNKLLFVSYCHGCSIQNQTKKKVKLRHIVQTRYKEKGADAASVCLSLSAVCCTWFLPLKDIHSSALLRYFSSVC